MYPKKIGESKKNSMLECPDTRHLQKNINNKTYEFPKFNKLNNSQGVVGYRQYHTLPLLRSHRYFSTGVGHIKYSHVDVLQVVDVNKTHFNF